MIILYSHLQFHGIIVRLPDEVGSITIRQLPFHRSTTIFSIFRTSEYYDTVVKLAMVRTAILRWLRQRQYLGTLCLQAPKYYSTIWIVSWYAHPDEAGGITILQLLLHRSTIILSIFKTSEYYNTVVKLVTVRITVLSEEVEVPQYSVAYTRDSTRVLCVFKTSEYYNTVVKLATVRITVLPLWRGGSTAILRCLHQRQYSSTLCLQDVRVL
jgi:hypothetical protein